MHQAIYRELQRVAKAQRVTTYSEIAPMAGLEMANPDHRTQIGHILGDISRYEHSHGRPMLSAVVVHAENNMPGKGFFTLAQELGLQIAQDDLTFFSSELARVHAAWIK